MDSTPPDLQSSYYVKCPTNQSSLLYPEDAQEQSLSKWLYCKIFNRKYVVISGAIIFFTTIFCYTVFFSKDNLTEGVSILKLNKDSKPHKETVQDKTSSKQNDFLELLKKSDLSKFYNRVIEFEKFIETYEKVYASAEEKLRRFRIFIERVESIEEHNKSNSTYKQGINKFTDLEEDEMRQYMGYIMPSEKRNQHSSLSEVKNTTIPTSVNWVKKGCVSEIKDQGKCGSCWAFSASGAVEGAYCSKHGILPDLSEQQLVDCARREGTLGCKGGAMDQAFLYMIKEKGLCSEQAYPYHAQVGKCQAKACLSQVKVLGFVDIPAKNELALMATVARHGPVSVGVDSDDWQFYHSGIYSAPCGKTLNHAVLVVGYGSENGIDYWLIKNSWGPSWGEKGFMKLIRNIKKKSGECGILLAASYPVVE